MRNGKRKNLVKKFQNISELARENSHHNNVRDQISVTLSTFRIRIFMKEGRINNKIKKSRQARFQVSSLGFSDIGAQLISEGNCSEEKNCGNK